MSDEKSRVGAVQELEMELLFEAVFRHSGYDFRGYAPGSLQRRVAAFLKDRRLGSISALQAAILHDDDCLEDFLSAISVSVTSLFRDPEVYRALRADVIPSLRSLPFVRVWVAGCATGEEVFSLAIVLQEEGLYDKTRIYATDLHTGVLERAGSGVCTLKALRAGTKEYQKAGGTSDFSTYYTARYGNALWRADLRRNLVFFQHNLATDASFNEFHLILCRNVLIYFGLPLQQRVHRLLFDSLATPGFLVLGDQETLQFSGLEQRFDIRDQKHRIFQKRAERNQT